MAEQNNTTCAICGKGYYLCLACKSHKLTPWRLHTDTSEHYKIFQILRGYFLKIYTIDEAKAKLQNVDLSDLDIFKDDIKSQIKMILESKLDKEITTKNTETASSDNVDVKVQKVKRASRTKKKPKIVETE